MKNVIKITTLAIVLTFLSAMVLSAQEHNMSNMHKVDNTTQNIDIKKIDKNNDGLIFECPMKCETATDMPGECSKCGMKLKEVSINDATKAVNCEGKEKSGCCEKEMTNDKSKMMEKHGKKMDHSKMIDTDNMMDHDKRMEKKSEYKNIDKNNDGIVYECPMKCEDASDKPGECSKCGMQLKEVKAK